MRSAPDGSPARACHSLIGMRPSAHPSQPAADWPAGSVSRSPFVVSRPVDRYRRLRRCHLAQRLQAEADRATNVRQPPPLVLLVSFFPAALSPCRSFQQSDIAASSRRVFTRRRSCCTIVRTRAQTHARWARAEDLDEGSPGDFFFFVGFRCGFACCRATMRTNPHVARSRQFK